MSVIRPPMKLPTGPTDQRAMTVPAPDMTTLFTEEFLPR